MATVQRTDANTALVETFVDAIWNGHALDKLDTLSTPDFVVHGLGANVDRSGDEFRSFHEGLLDAVPDLEHDIDTLVADGDRVVAYVSIRGTPAHPYGALQPTGRTFDTVGFQQYRIEDGRVAEVWVLPNAMGMLRQLGIFPDGPGDVLRLMGRAIVARLRGR